MPNFNVVDQESFYGGLFFLVENSYYPLLIIIRAYMGTSSTSAIRIASEKSKKLSKEQQAFNRLIKNIQKERACLQEWENIIPLYKAKQVDSLVPLIDQHTGHLAEMVIKLDHTYKTAKFSKTYREKLSMMITDMAADVVQSTAREDIKQIFNIHSKSDFDAEEAEHMDMIKAMLEQELGVELEEDEGFDSPESLFNLAQRLKERAIEEEAQRPPRKKTAKMLEKEARQAEEAAKLKQPIKEIYRKLAQELHPDREQDEAQRAKKHEMMQRANIAYKSKNLLELLELQFEIEQSSQAEISTTSTDRLKCYNKILQEQLSTIRMEVDMVSHPFHMELSSRWGKAPDPGNVIALLEMKIREVKKGITKIQEDLKLFENPANVREWLKGIRTFHFG